MKIILVSAASMMLLASPLRARSQTAEGPSHSRVYSRPRKQLGAGYRGLDGSERKSYGSASHPQPANQGLCSTAPGFCADYHGSNGG
jgi:hypothetical protein